MRKDLQNMQESLLPGRETREWMWEAIEEKAARGQKRRRKKQIAKWACGIAAAIFIGILCLPQTGLAEGMKNLFHKFLYVDMDESQEVMYDVYEDEDEHVRMQIQEMLSDGSCMYFNICYEALDGVGREWLSGYDFMRYQGGSSEIRFVSIGDDDDHIGATGMSERKELSTDSKRYFTIYNKDLGNFNGDNVTQTLFYPMYHKQGIGKIMLKRNLETFTYRLVGEGSPSQYYMPKYMKASKLSFAISGDNTGAFVWNEDEEGNFWPLASKGFEAECEEMNKELDNCGEIKVVFHMKDGEELSMRVNSGWPIFDWDAFANGEKPDLGKMNVVTDYYFEDDGGESNNIEEDPSKWLVNINRMVNPQDMAGVELNGVYYELEPCEIPEGYLYP